MKITRHYRISSWRFDVATSIVENPSFEGETEAECDEMAIARMHEFSSRPEYEWSGLSVVRIDAPAVAEKVTLLVRNGRQEGDYD